MKDKETELLKMAVERAVDFKTQTTRGFERLALVVQHRTHENISVSTLKRLWGYVKGYDDVRTSTLDVLCHFLGYKDFAHFTEIIKNEDDVLASNFFIGECVCASDLFTGNRLTLTWAPGRRCEIRYDGDYRFTVMDSVATRLVEGTSFYCHIFEVGQPAYLSKVLFPSDPQHEYNYVAGTNGGIRIERN